MGTIRIRIGHDNDLIIVGVFHREICPNSSTDGVDHGVDFLVLEDITHIGLLSIKNLPTKWKNRLELPIPSLFGRTAG